MMGTWGAAVLLARPVSLGSSAISIWRRYAVKPERMMEEAVRGMLPKSKLGDAMFRKLKVYVGDKHPHTAQSPTVFEVA